MDPTTGTMDGVDDQPPQHRMRAADNDREQIAEQLRAAHSEGRLDLAEYDQRFQQAWAARTYGELEALTADFPQARPLRPPARRARPRLGGDAVAGGVGAPWSWRGPAQVRSTS